MTVKSLITISAEEAREILRGVGFRISRDLLIRGIKQGQFAFGSVIETESETRCIIYLAQLERFIGDRLCDEQVPEVPTEEEQS